MRNIQTPTTQPLTKYDVRAAWRGFQVHDRPGISDAWLVAALATRAISILVTLTAPTAGDVERLVLLLTVRMNLPRAILYFVVITLIFYAFTFIKIIHVVLRRPETAETCDATPPSGSQSWHRFSPADLLRYLGESRRVAEVAAGITTRPTAAPRPSGFSSIFIAMP